MSNPFLTPSESAQLGQLCEIWQYTPAGMVQLSSVDRPARIEPKKIDFDPGWTTVNDGWIKHSSGAGLPGNTYVIKRVNHAGGMWLGKRSNGARKFLYVAGKRNNLNNYSVLTISGNCVGAVSACQRDLWKGKQ